MNQIVLVLASRQEFIFQLQIMEAQLSQMEQESKIQILRTIQLMIYKSEQKRVSIEHQTLSNYNESRKSIQKIVKRYIKIQAFFYQKLQLYFPIFSQRKQYLPLQRNQLFKIASNHNMTSIEIIKHIISIQKDKLNKQIDSLIRSIAKIDPIPLDLQTNRNEKFYNEPYSNLKYLTYIHLTYYLLPKQPQISKDPYDILQLEEQHQAGFKSYVPCLGNLKNVFTQIESTQEIILYRYEKLQKQLIDQNLILSKRMDKFYIKNFARSQSAKPPVQSVQRLPLKTIRRSQLTRNRQSHETRGSCTFQDGFLTDKEGIDALPNAGIASNLKQIILGNSKQQIEQRRYLVKDREPLREQLLKEPLREQFKEPLKHKIVIQSSLILCGKQVSFPSSEIDKRRNHSNLDKGDQSLLQIAKNAKLQKLGITSKFQLIKLKQHCK